MENVKTALVLDPCTACAKYVWLPLRLPALCVVVQFPALGLVAMEVVIGLAHGKPLTAQIVTVIVVDATAPVPVK